MSSSGPHPLWPRVAGVVARLPGHLRVQRHTYRGRPWYVVQDRASGHHYRFPERSYRFVASLDGRRTVDQVWRAEVHDPTGAGPGQDEVIRLLAGMHAAGMLRLDPLSEATGVFAPPPAPRRRWQRWLGWPLMLRLPLCDPDRLLARALPWVRPLIGRPGLVLWVAVVSLGVLLGAAHAGELAAYGATRGLDPATLAQLWLTYAVVKAVHELGHAFTTRAWGGEVHEMGVMFLVFMPLPYVDASQASAFPDKRRRMAVGAAGILVEVFLAAAALLVWLAVEPGAVREVAFDVMLVGGFSTVLFNGNPLLRYDGYYVLADALEIPNLGTRSVRYLDYLARRYLFGLRDAPSPVETPGERPWLLAYGLASAAYRLLLAIVIALYVAGRFFLLGVVLAVWVLAGRIAYPIGRYLVFVLSAPALRARRTRAVSVTAVALLALAGTVLLLPLPSWTRAEGVVQLPERSVVRAGGDGRVASLLRPSGERVLAGAPLLELRDPRLVTRAATLEWRLRESQARRDVARLKDRVQAAIYAEEVADLEAQLHEARERLARLVVRSPMAGTWFVPKAGDLPGQFVRQGQTLGYVIAPDLATARVVVPQDDAQRVRGQTEAVELRLAGAPGVTLASRLLREVPAASERLPSRALGTPAGGPIPVDPADPEGLKARTPVFQLDLALPPGVARGHIGARVHARFHHPPETLAERWYRRLRQLFLARFGV